MSEKINGAEGFNLKALMAEVNDYINSGVEKLSDKVTFEINPDYLGQIEAARMFAEGDKFRGCNSKEEVLARVAEMMEKESDEDKKLGLGWIKESLE